jgi:hypothetical protein
VLAGQVKSAHNEVSDRLENPSFDDPVGLKPKVEEALAKLLEVLDCLAGERHQLKRYCNTWYELLVAEIVLKWPTISRAELSALAKSCQTAKPISALATTLASSSTSTTRAAISSSASEAGSSGSDAWSDLLCLVLGLRVSRVVSLLPSIFPGFPWLTAHLRYVSFFCFVFNHIY